MNRFNSFAHRVLGKSLFGAAMLACALAGLAERAGGHVDAAPPAPLARATEWPSDAQGQPLRPLALSRVEQRFAERFPGRIARLTDGRQIVVLRDVDRPTRMLHPAADCYRALGYRIEGEQLEISPPRSPAGAWSAAPRGGRTPPSDGRAAGWIEPPRSPAGAWSAAPRGGLTPPSGGRAAGWVEPPRPPAGVADVQRCFTARQGSTALRVCEQIEDAQGQRFADTSAWFWAATTGRSTGPWRAVTVTRALGPGLW